MVQVAEDAIEAIWRQHGMLGLARLLADIAIRIPAEHLAELRQDVRLGLRTLAGSPGFTAVALISLSLGICVATSAFSELNAVILRDVPGVAQPDRLVVLQPAASYPAYERIRERGSLFSSTFAYVAPVPFGVSIGGHTERAWGHLVTPSYFSTLGVRPVLGRFFDLGQEQAQAPDVVISYRFWQNHLGSNPLVVGKTLRVNGHECTILGVGPKGFLGAAPLVFYADLWLPVSVDTRVAPELADHALERRDRKIFQVIGRLQPGVTVQRAEAELDTVARQFEQAYGEEDLQRRGRRTSLLPGGKVFPVGLAGVTAYSVTQRGHEIGIRIALGAGRGDVLRLVMGEGLVLVVAGTVLGLAGAWGAARMLSTMIAALATATSASTSDPVLLVGAPLLLAGLALAACYLPARKSTRIDPVVALRQE
ncbi:MAG TPA: ABC transporter permease [Bryobacteraceae bacterium]